MARLFLDEEEASIKHIPQEGEEPPVSHIDRTFLFIIS